jgi:hypothetical protein
MAPLNEIVGVAEFRCVDHKKNEVGKVYENVSILADWRESPSVLAEQFRDAAERLRSLSPNLCDALGGLTALFSGRILENEITRPGVFTCMQRGEQVWMSHVVYSARIPDETPDETQARLEYEAETRHEKARPENSQEKPEEKIVCDEPPVFTGDWLDDGLPPLVSSRAQPRSTIVWEKVAPKSAWQTIEEVAGKFGMANEHMLKHSFF